MGEAVSLVTTKTDADRAAEIRAKLGPILDQAAAVVGEARRDGLIVGFNIGTDQFGRTRVLALDITKPL